MKKTQFIAAALSVALSLSVAWAGPFTYPADWSANKPSEAVRGGTMRVPTLQDFKTLNPFTTAESPNLPDVLSAGGLVSRDPADNGKWIPYMAESYTVSSDRTVYTFKIRKGMKWSDGQAINADDWVTTFKIHTDEKVGSNSYDSFFINGKPVKVSRVDDYTLKIVFPKVDVDALSIAAFAPWPDHIFAPVYKSKGAEGIKDMWGLSEDPDNVVVSGPFKLEKYIKGERAILVRNPKFGEWNLDSAGKPLPYLDRVQVSIVKDQPAILASFLAGDLDIYTPVTRDDLAQVASNIKEGKVKADLRANVSPRASSDFIVFNWNKSSEPAKEKLFRNAKFRQAMSMLADREAMVDLVLGGLGTPTYTGVYPVYKDWVASGVDKYKYNAQGAAKLLAELGYKKKDKDGYLVDAKGRRLEFTLTTNAGNARREQFAKIFAESAKKVGVKVNTNFIAFNQMTDQLDVVGADRPFDAILIGLVGGSQDFPVSGSNVVLCDANLHMYNQSNKCLAPFETQLVNLYYKGRQELDTAKRKQIATQMQKVESENQPYIFLAAQNQHYAWANSLQGEHAKSFMSARWSSTLFGPRFAELSFIKK